jgi:L-lysine exporter family protein LysE/ArgO
MPLFRWNRRAMLELFVSGFVLSLSLCLDLGIVNVAAFSTAATRGARAAFVLGVGSCFGDLVYAGIAMLGVTSLLLHFEWVRWVLWLGGSTVLVYLAAKMLRLSFARPAPVAPNSSAAQANTANRQMTGDFSRGFAMALASPSAILWFASVGGGLIATTAGGAGAGAWPFFLGFFVSGLAWSAFVALAGSRLQAHPGFARGLAAVSAVLFAALAAKLMVDGYRTLI